MFWSKNVKPSIIAIDGPAASGKSTIAKRLADSIGYLYFDTGVMYRAITWVALQKNVDVNDQNLVELLAETIRIDVLPPSKDDGRDSDIVADGKDITWEIRHPDVDSNVSLVAAYPGVRTAMTTQQRRIGKQGYVVMVGRDIGTVVLPDADLKVYLDASVEERARRRYIESRNRCDSVSYNSVLENMKKRDEIDSTRDIAPLRAAEDACIIDTDNMSIEAVVEITKTYINEWRPA
jgi:cytidylate kinase